ncbi:MAG: ABC transporter ATP-binding protein [Clostridiales bacterium]|nr:MAG: ABC transporter ATP-binding protein [Clostridiales bacterium]
MAILSAQDLSKIYGIDVIFEDVCFKIENKEKIGIVGANGAGKTTLFRLVTGEEEPDSGIIIREKDLTLAYMSQHSDFTSEKNAIDEVLTIFEKQLEIEREIERVTTLLQTSQDEHLFNRIHSLNEVFAEEGGLTFRARIKSALLGLGLTEDEIILPLSSLSGGQRTRVLLAKVLLSDASLLLLDEPTNHLDIAATEWLEDFLQNYRGAVVLISHDRFFLDRICQKTFELENKRLKIYGGNYTYYKEKKAFDRLTLERDYEQKQKEIKRIEGIIEQQKRFNQERNYVTIKSKLKQIERIEKTVEKPEKEPDEIHFNFQACSGAANEALVLKNVSKSFGGKSLFKNADLLIKSGEKVFLTGKNGCGKTTMFRIILNKVKADSGNIIIGNRVKIGYYDQALSDLDDGNTVFEEISNAYPKMTNGEIRSALGSFLFCGDDVFKSISALSGGERARVLLVKLILSQTNFLMLDEPTNHLDIASKEVLEQALKQYNGTLFVVSHDRYFINTLADKIALMNEEGITVYEGDYENYLDKISGPLKAEKEKTQKGQSDYEKRKNEESEKRKRQTRIKRIEKDIEKREEAIQNLTKEIETPEIAADYNKLSEVSALLEKEQAELDRLFYEWEEVMQNEE